MLMCMLPGICTSNFQMFSPILYVCHVIGDLVNYMVISDPPTVEAEEEVDLIIVQVLVILYTYM